MPSGRRRTRRAASSSCSTDKPSATSRAGTRPRRPTGSSSSSTIRRSGSQRTRVTTWPSSTPTCPPPRGPRGRTSRTSGSGLGSRTSSTRCETTTWPPSASKTARLTCFLLANDAERAAQAAQAVRVALVRVLTRLEREGPGLLADERHGRLLVHAGPEQVEVVDRGLVLHLDLEARADFSFEDWSRGLSRYESDCRDGGDDQERERNSSHGAPSRWITKLIREGAPSGFVT